MIVDQDMLDVAADFLNSELFNCALPRAAIRIDRTHALLGAYAGKHLSGRAMYLFNDEMHESHHPGIIAVCTTLTHELCHAWASAQLGRMDLSGHGGHNAEWFVKMYSVGLRPTWARSESGRMTTRDSVIPHGKFAVAALRLAGYFGATQ